MPRPVTNYTIGNVGKGATVQQGKYLFHIEVKLENADDLEKLITKLEKKGSYQHYSGQLLRRLESLTLDTIRKILWARNNSQATNGAMLLNYIASAGPK